MWGGGGVQHTEWKWTCCTGAVNRRAVIAALVPQAEAVGAGGLIFWRWWGRNGRAGERCLSNKVLLCQSWPAGSLISLRPISITLLESILAVFGEGGLHPGWVASEWSGHTRREKSNESNNDPHSRGWSWETPLSRTSLGLLGGEVENPGRWGGDDTQTPRDQTAIALTR